MFDSGWLDPSAATARSDAAHRLRLQQARHARLREAWGLLLPRNAHAQSASGKPVALRELEPGDLVFYNTRERPYSHVGIYLGDGLFIHAPRPPLRAAGARMDSMITILIDIANESHYRLETFPQPTRI